MGESHGFEEGTMKGTTTMNLCDARVPVHAYIDRVGAASARGSPFHYVVMYSSSRVFPL